MHGAAAAVVLSLGLLRGDPPPTRDQTRATVERGAPVSRIAVVAPVANRRVDIPDVIFVWHAMEAGDTYRLTILDSAGGRLWTTSTRDTTSSVPIAPPLARGRTYLWYVDALASDGHTVTSGVRSFSAGP